ncbi:MAG TPA: hypothetical protein VF691_17025 [Cytophagaceae bacterium]|jgi:hypothetical protein
MIKSILAISTLVFLFSCGNPDPGQGEKSSGSGENLGNNEGARIIDTMATESNAGSQQDSSSSSANHSTNESHSHKEGQADIVDQDK